MELVIGCVLNQLIGPRPKLHLKFACKWQFTGV